MEKQEMHITHNDILRLTHRNRSRHISQKSANAYHKNRSRRGERENHSPEDLEENNSREGREGERTASILQLPRRGERSRVRRAAISPVSLSLSPSLLQFSPLCPNRPYDYVLCKVRGNLSS